MTKKVVIIVSIVIILIVAGYIGYKTYILNKYNVADLGNTYQEIIESFNNEETVTINNQQLSEEEIKAIVLSMIEHPEIKTVVFHITFSPVIYLQARETQPSHRSDSLSSRPYIARQSCGRCIPP